MSIRLEKLIKILEYNFKKYGDIPVYVGNNEWDIFPMMSNDYDFVSETKMGYSNPLPDYLVIGRGVSRE